MLLKVALDFALGDLNLLADFLAHHLLRDDAVADVGFEVLPGHTLFLGRLFQVFQGFQVVLLAELVQLLDHLGFAVDVQFLALGEPELLVDEAAQQVFVGLGGLLHGGAVLFGLLVQILERAIVIGPRDDLVVHAGNDALDRGSAVGALRRGGMRLRQRVTCEQHRSEHERREIAK